MTAGLRALALGAGIFLASISPARGDRLHLEGGGTIVVAEWWIEGGTLFYRSAAGTIGIPRDAVLKIEPGPAPAQTETQAQPAPAPKTAASATLSSDVLRTLRDAKLALERRDFEVAADLYGRVLADPDLDPDFHLPRVGYALSRIALDEDAAALGVVLDGLARDPHDPALLELLGDLRNREERVHDAVRAWRTAFDREPSDRLRAKIEKAERELAIGRDYEMTTTSHFNLRFDGAADPRLTQAVSEYLEQRYWIVGEALEHTPDQPITVLLYPKIEFRDVTRAPENVGGLFDGKIRAPLGGLRRLDPAAAAVLTHELTHAIVHSKTRGNCPRWLHEGLAQHFEGKRLGRAELRQVAERLQAGDPADWESRGFSYALALSLTEYLAGRSGFHRLVDLLDELAGGADLDSGMRRTYGMDYASLCRQWRDSLRIEREP